MLWRIAIVLALLAPTPVLADFQSGNQLFSSCTATAQRSPTDLTFCLGYIAAMGDAMGHGASIEGFRACPVVGVEIGQLKDIVINALQRNPAERHHSAEGLVASALAGAFPCK